MSEEVKLLPCPVSWCDNPKPQVFQRSALFRVRCNECQTETPLYHTQREAIAAWNTRAPS